MLSTWMKSQKLRAPAMKNESVFYRNIEEALDVRRADHALYNIKENIWKSSDAVDFCSNDLLSLGASGLLREKFMAELALYPNFTPGAGGSRMMDGNYEYLENLEREIAEFHGAETGLFVGSGFEANLAIFAAIPRPGDVIVYDELVHASSIEGMEKHSLANCRFPFSHNDVESFRDVLLNIWETQTLVKQGVRSVIVAVESIYSMDGDVCPLEELMEAAAEIFPGGQVQFYVDEAHSTGVIGPRGSGFVCELGLEKSIPIRLHTFGKAIASAGAIILCNHTVKAALTNFARSVIYTTAPSFIVAASVRAGYKLLKDGQTEAGQKHIQHLVKHFFKTITADPIWAKASKAGALSCPLAEDWEERAFVTHIVPIWTRPRYTYWLMFHLLLSKFCAYGVEYPTVPKGQSRVRVTFHANNTEAETDGLAQSICSWAREMLDLEEAEAGEDRIPKAARQVYSWMADEAIEVTH
ncbi:5-aminolevulinate synthase [Periconia macrospinosa]|uniref:5-aminolevulinate synthase n=1 Tax=Periconia macrospinosa TaxID=97972 RepID=A0A2V1DB90_9PLEO|nr:5-aminolevulinate synthase [Periconia macrospinosa]